MKVAKRRRREGKTNYLKRLRLLKGGYPRLVIRKTNRYIILQVVESEEAQDRVKWSVNTKELLKLGWPSEKKGSLKSLPAAYLSGLLLGKKANVKGKIILDIGLTPSTKGSRIYAAAKGAKDAGMEIAVNEDVLPTEEQISGKFTKINEEIFNRVKNKILSIKENGEK